MIASADLLATLAGLAILLALALYAVTGGADFGGGVWDLFARGPRAERQRRAIEHAIGPIWEANHVWLILAVVLLFVCFPRAYAVIGMALHVPITLLLIGIVLRGSAFAFRSYGDLSRSGHGRWGRVFAIASLLTPIMLGVVVGALSSGRIRVPPTGEGFVADYVNPWLAPFPLGVGAFTLALFSFLAAVYLMAETRDEKDLSEDFRRRALAAAAAVAIVGAFVLFVLAPRGAPLLAERLGPAGSRVLFWLALAAFVGTVLLVLRRRPIAARVFAALVVFEIVVDWGVAQFPDIVMPTVNLFDAAAPVAVLRLVLLALVAGGVLLLPALFYLFRVFKGARASEAGRRPPRAAER
jgi:cytochrome d ubiquinol oxidase subunit II